MKQELWSHCQQQDIFSSLLLVIEYLMDGTWVHSFSINLFPKMSRLFFTLLFNIPFFTRGEMEIVFSGAIDAIWPAAIFAISHFTNIRKAARLRRERHKTCFLASRPIWWLRGSGSGCACDLQQNNGKKAAIYKSCGSFLLSLILRGSQHPGC
jgi:hypothetical protein